MPVAPFGAADRRSHALGGHFSDARQVLQQPVLLRGELRLEGRVLRDAAAADAEVRAARRAAFCRSILNGQRAGELMPALALDNGDARALAGQRAFDEQYLAVGLARDAAALGVERVDLDRQLFQSERNSCQWGRFWRTR
jgi:hypothetical protein